MILVCPRPAVWHEIYRRCDQAWSESGRCGEPPPAPLVLSGWAFSSDVDKQERWQALLRWSEERSLTHLVALHLPDDGYYVHSICKAYPGEHYGCQDHAPAPFPNAAELGAAIERLYDSWAGVAGSLAQVCKPVEFLGAKGRRLLVLVTENVDPPWGRWDQLSDRSRKHEFTAFRRRVNEVIAPHHVDHIDFRVRTLGP